MQERRAHHEALLHPVREALDQLVLPPAQLEQVEHLVHAIHDAVAIEPVQARVEPQELAGRELLVDERAVGNEPERGLRELRLGGGIMAVHDDASRGRLQQAGDHPQRRRLARAVRPEEAVNLARLHVERDVVNRRELAVLLDQVVERRSSSCWPQPPAQPAAVRVGLLCTLTGESGTNRRAGRRGSASRFSSSVMSSTLILMRPMSGRIDACLSSPPRARPHVRGVRRKFVQRRIDREPETAARILRRYTSGHAW